jgi:hypothetical protein
MFNYNKDIISSFLIKLTIFLSLILVLNSCIKWNPKSAKNLPTNSQDRARQNVEEGRGISVKNLVGGARGTNYEFSTSNPMWRASLEIIDFLPLTTVDYSGGLIISDWYSDNVNDNTQLKITIRFLSNEINVTNLKIIVHKKICEQTNALNCKIQIEPSPKIKEELTKNIIRLASKLEQEQKK